MYFVTRNLKFIFPKERNLIRRSHINSCFSWGILLPPWSLVLPLLTLGSAYWVQHIQVRREIEKSAKSRETIPSTWYWYTGTHVPTNASNLEPPVMDDGPDLIGKSYTITQANTNRLQYIEINIRKEKKIRKWFLLLEGQGPDGTIRTVPNTPC